MMSFLQAGKALYVLATICLTGVFTKLMAEGFYKRLIKESTNIALIKNRYLRGLKQNTENTYRMDQGMNNTHVYLEHQMCSLRTFGMSVKRLDNLSRQLILLCFLAGDEVAFLSCWFKSDNYYTILYGTTGTLAGMFTMLMNYGMNLESRKQQLLTYLQDYLENVM